IWSFLPLEWFNVSSKHPNRYGSCFTHFHGHQMIPFDYEMFYAEAPEAVSRRLDKGSRPFSDFARSRTLQDRCVVATDRRQDVKIMAFLLNSLFRHRTDCASGRAPLAILENCDVGLRCQECVARLWFSDHDCTQDGSPQWRSACCMICAAFASPPPLNCNREPNERIFYS